jgi:hypothetical protein
MKANVGLTQTQVGGGTMPKSRHPVNLTVSPAHFVNG